MTSVRSPNVQTIAMPVPLSGCGHRMREHRHLDVEERRPHATSGPRSARRTGGRPARRTPAAAPAGWCPPRPARPDRGTAAGGTPPGRSRSSSSACATAVRNPTSHSVGASAVYASPRARLLQERPLRHRLRLGPDRRVRHRPVDRQPEPPPQRPRTPSRPRPSAARTARRSCAGRSRSARLRRPCRRLPVRVVRQRRVAPDAVDVLHPALGRQAVVVPAHRVEDGLAAHPLEPGDHVGVRVREDVPHVQLARYGRRRRVDRVYVRALLRAVERIRALLLPAARPLLLETVQGRPFGETGARGPPR